jgi:hypothetical protein
LPKPNPHARPITHYHPPTLARSLPMPKTDNFGPTSAPVLPRQVICNEEIDVEPLWTILFIHSFMTRLSFNCAMHQP